jgi:hypothetical protein
MNKGDPNRNPWLAKMMNIVQQFKYNNSNDYELIKRIGKQVIKLI